MFDDGIAQFDETKVYTEVVGDRLFYIHPLENGMITMSLSLETMKIYMERRAEALRGEGANLFCNRLQKNT